MRIFLSSVLFKQTPEYLYLDVDGLGQLLTKDQTEINKDNLNKKQNVWEERMNQPEDETKRISEHSL